MKAILRSIFVVSVSMVFFVNSAYAATAAGCCDSASERTSFKTIREDGFLCEITTCSGRCLVRGAGECDAQRIKTRTTGACPSECSGGRPICQAGRRGELNYCCPEGSSCDGQGGCEADPEPETEPEPVIEFP